jgi:hypothetical protein
MNMNSQSMRKQYLQILPKLNKALVVMQHRLSHLPTSDFTVEINLKPYASVKRKVVGEKVANLLDVSDLVRGRVFFSQRYTFLEVIDLLRQVLGKIIRTVDKKDDREYGLEYCGVIHLDLLIDGIKFELQLIPIEFKPYKDFLHSIYQALRSTNQLSDGKKHFLRRIHNKIYHQLDRQSKKNREFYR